MMKVIGEEKKKFILENRFGSIVHWAGLRSSQIELGWPWLIIIYIYIYVCFAYGYHINTSNAIRLLRVIPNVMCLLKLSIDQKLIN
jgi:hypothetical protein